MTIHAHLRALYDEHGVLTPAMVVEAARPARSPLHSHFEWDNKVAGEKYRLVQAGILIRKVKVQVLDETSPLTRVRGFHSVTETGDDEEPSTSYVPHDIVAADPVLTALVLRAMKRRWLEMKRTYEHHVEFWEMVRDDLEDTG